MSLLQKSLAVIPAKAGIQSFQDVLDPGFRRGAGFVEFCKSLVLSAIVDTPTDLIEATPGRTGVSAGHSVEGSDRPNDRHGGRSYQEVGPSGKHPRRERSDKTEYATVLMKRSTKELS